MDFVVPFFVWSTIYPMSKWLPVMDYGCSGVLILLGSLTIHRTPYLPSAIAAVVGVLMSTYPLTSMHQAYKEMQENGDGFAMQESCDIELMIPKDLASMKAAEEISRGIGEKKKGCKAVM